MKIYLLDFQECSREAQDWGDNDKKMAWETVVNPLGREMRLTADSQKIWPPSRTSLV